ncbi:MAG: protein kinase [Candidatus Binatia bacterium]|nr:protein kinase [Candidatus Binatia bacterium]MDG2011342.1 protein kinase [Candidatus Binatia bacterium]
MKDRAPEEMQDILRANPALDFRDPEMDLHETIRPEEPLDSNTPTILVPGTRSPSPDTEKENERPPPPAQGFEIRDLLGRGGMNVVYRALQRDLQREVGIKKIRPEKERLGSAQRDFLREARVTGALEHPNILPVHGISVNEKGDIALAMKLIEGQTWAELLHPQTPAGIEAARGFDLTEHLRLLITVSNAVSFAHSRGVIHRDIKPENVMVGAFGEVVLMDWGIALETGIEDSGSRAPGPRVRLAGTPAYMAPEMVSPGGRNISQQTDVYLLGALLFELLEGKAPQAAGTLFEALALATSSRPPKFSEDTPGELADLCRRAMAHDPAQRPSNAREFRQAVEEYLSHRESLAISSNAAALLAATQTSDSGVGAPEPEHRADLYSQMSRIIAGFEQARLLWPENPEALQGEDDARFHLAETALESGDLVMAASAINALPTACQGVLQARLSSARGAREKARHAARRTGAGLIVLQIVIALILGVFAWGELDEFYHEETALRLRDVNPLAMAALREAGSLEPEIVDPILDEIAAGKDMRLTVLDTDGRVLGDSHGDPGKMENHGNRREIREALQTGEGSAVRDSTVQKSRVVYYARPMLDDAGKPVAIVRTSLPWSAVHESLLDFLTPLASALIISVLVGALGTWLAWRRLDRRVAQL